MVTTETTRGGGQFIPLAAGPVSVDRELSFDFRRPDEPSGPDFGEYFSAMAGPAPRTDSAGTTTLRNVVRSGMTVFRPDKANGASVIIVPGGGFRILSWVNEGIKLARLLTARGYLAAVVKYRLVPTPADHVKFEQEFFDHLAALQVRLAAVPPGQRAATRRAGGASDRERARARAWAMADVRESVRTLRSRADEFGVVADRIAVVGYSAGAYLAVDLATECESVSRPDAIAAIYGGDLADRRTHGRVLPPLFVLATGDDPVTPVDFAEGLVRGWRDANAHVEYHLFACGGHGFGVPPRDLAVDIWPELLAGWLEGAIARR